MLLTSRSEEGVQRTRGRWLVPDRQRGGRRTAPLGARPRGPPTTPGSAGPPHPRLSRSLIRPVTHFATGSLGVCQAPGLRVNQAPGLRVNLAPGLRVNQTPGLRAREGPGQPEPSQSSGLHLWEPGGAF